MLSTLSVRNIVLIDQLDLAFEAGLSVLTGETGAGKSILLDALTLALGGRGDASLVRKGMDTGQVVAVLHLGDDHPARRFIRENEIQDDAEVILRRIQYTDGRTRAFVNDQPVSAGLLKTIGELLVEIHGQHADRALIDVETHRVLLDSFGQYEGEVANVAAAYTELSKTQRELNKHQAMVLKATQDEDYARHVVEELLALKLVEGEELELSERRQHLMGLEKAAGEVVDAEDVLNGNNAPGPMLALLLRRLARKADGEGGLFEPLVEAVDGALVALDLANDALQEIQRQMDFDPKELEAVEERLFALRATARKHHCDPNGLLAVLEKYQADLKAIEHGADRLQALEKALVVAKAEYTKCGYALSELRGKFAAELEAAVAAELPDLRLGSAKFIVDQKVDENLVSANGFDQIEFYVQTNPGTNPGPMMKVASGGELSRFLLALKVVLADKGSVPVLVFDEIDTGVGGAVADAIGRRLARLGRNVQVLTVTHAPQVAARAKTHLLIEKQAIEEGAFMRTHVRALDDTERGAELARMLAGEHITDEALAAARRLMSEVDA